MKKLLLTSLLAISINTFADVSPQIESQIRAMIPNTKITAINPAPYAGMYEVLAGDNAFYLSTKNESEVIVGHIVNIKKMQDETQARIEAVNAKRFNFKSIDISNALKVGNGKKKVIVFIDPDCPYCQQLEEYLHTKLDKLTVYYMFIPLPMHPNAIPNTKQILCADKPTDAIFDFMVKHKDLQDGSLSCQTRVDAIIKSNETLAAANGINATPFALTDTNTVIGGYNVAAFEQFIKGKQK